MAGTGGHAGQTDWRDWGAGLPGDPAERARAAEVGLAEALAVSDVPKAPGPGPLAGEERCLAGQAAREASPAVRLADVCETLSIPKSTYLSQRARLSRPDPEAALRARVRASFEASGGAFGSESVWADLRRGEGEPVPWGDLGGRGDPGRRLREGGAPGDARGGPRAPQGGPDAPEGEVQQLRREVRREGGQPVPPRGRGARLPRRRARPALRRRRHRVPAGRLQGLPRRGRRLPRRLAGVPGGVSPRPDAGLALGTLGDLVAAVRPTEARPPVVHGDGGAARSMSRKAGSPDNARCEGVLRHPQERLLPRDRLEGRDVRGVPREAGRPRRVARGRQAEEGARMEDAEGAPHGAGLRGVAVVQRNVRGPLPPRIKMTVNYNVECLRALAASASQGAHTHRDSAC